jgi:hypothetical protein
LGALLIGGCAASGSDPVADYFRELFGPRKVQTASPAAHPPGHVAPPGVALADPNATRARRPAAKPRQSPPAEAPQSAPADQAAPDPSPKLIGLTQNETAALLGPPSSQWERPPAKVWHYQGPDCTLDIFFYLDLSRNEFSALHFAAAGPDGAAPPNQQCVSRIHDVAQHK